MGGVGVGCRGEGKRVLIHTHESHLKKGFERRRKVYSTNPACVPLFCNKLSRYLRRLSIGSNPCVRRFCLGASLTCADGPGQNSLPKPQFPLSSRFATPPPLPPSPPPNSAAGMCKDDGDFGRLWPDPPAHVLLRDRSFHSGPVLNSSLSFPLYSLSLCVHHHHHHHSPLIIIPFPQVTEFITVAYLWGQVFWGRFLFLPMFDWY